VLAVALLLAPAAAAEKDSTRTVQSTATTSPALLRAGDAVRISVLADSAGILDGTYVVDGRGDVFLPIVGRMPVASRSPQELRRFLDSSFVKYLRYPSVRVQRMVRVSFLGGFHRPGLYYVDPDLSFWDALAQAGGTEREDGLTKLYWVRDDRVVKRDMIPDLASGRTLREIGFESGDEVRVTTKPKRGGWEVFRTDVLPVLALGVGTAATTLAIIDLAGED
jgi:protein involved in polysaccharide export with SLBB domain